MDVQQWIDGLSITDSPPGSVGDFVHSMKRQRKSTDMPRELTKGNRDSGDDGRMDIDDTALDSQPTLELASLESSPSDVMADLACAKPPILHHEIHPDDEELPDDIQLLRRGVLRYMKSIGVIPAGLKV